MLETFDQRMSQARLEHGPTSVLRTQILEVVDILRTHLIARSPSAMFDSVRQDLRIAARGLFRNPLVSLLAVVSLALGISIALTKGLSAYLTDIRPFDLPLLVVLVGIMLSAALLASYLPAQRASKVDPVGSLRGD